MNKYIPFEVKLQGKLQDGRKITPRTLSIDKFSKIFQNYRRLIDIALIGEKDVAKSVNFIYKEGSAVFTSDLPAQGHEVFRKDLGDIATGKKFGYVSPQLPGVLVDMRDLVADLGDNVNITFGTGKKLYLTVTSKTKFDQFKNPVVDTEMIVYGKIYTVGGKDPNFHISGENLDENYIITVTEQQAKELATNLYDEAGVRIRIKKNILTGEISDAQYISKLIYARKLDEAKFKRDVEVGTRVWAGINPVEWEQERRKETV